MTDRVFSSCDETPDGWTVGRTLTLKDDGAFEYDEAWGSYGGSAEWRATGRYERGADVITLHVVDLSRDIAGMFQKGAALSAELIEGGAALVLDRRRLELRSARLIRRLDNQ